MNWVASFVCIFNILKKFKRGRSFWCCINLYPLDRIKFVPSTTRFQLHNLPSKVLRTFWQSNKNLERNDWRAGFGGEFWNSSARNIANRTFDIFLQRADIAVADLTITHKRTEVVDFTVSFMNTGEKWTDTNCFFGWFVRISSPH